MAIIARVRDWYARWERPLSSLSLIGGFVFDAITLRRVDMFWENFWVVAHLAIVTGCAIAINRLPNAGRSEENPHRLHFWLVNIMQFFFGGILSTYLVFYFRSGSVATSWPFLLLLAAAFFANERLKRHYARQAFQVALLFLAFYAFAIYLIPILFHQIGLATFLIAGAVSVLAITIVIAVSRAASRAVLGAVIGVLVAVNLLYFFKFIPPLPLSIKDAGIYQSLLVNAPGNYTVTAEDQGPLGFLAWAQTVHVMPGSPLYAYTAVFSPTSFSTDIVHVWEFYDPARHAWVTRGRVALPITGGADGGWRTFSEMPVVSAGSWRVNVETPDGGIIGELRFNVFVTSTPPALQTQLID